MLDAYNNYKDQNFTILTVSLDQNRKAWISAIENGGLPWFQLSDLKGFDNDVGKRYGITFIPMNYLIDPQGKIIANNLRGGELKKFLDKTLSK